MQQFLRKYYISNILLCIICIALLFTPSVTDSSKLPTDTGVITILNNTDKQTINSQVTVSIKLNTEGTTVNAVGLIIDYNTSIFSISSVDSSSSFCTLYIDRTYDASRGIIHLYCGKPNPGFSGENILETITFQTIAYGVGEVRVDPKSTVLENNGKGTNILTHFEKKDISVILSE